jgi:tocopherol cyclase
MLKTIKSILLLIFLVVSANSMADVDPFNTYQWNRDNYIAANGEVDQRPWFEWWYYKVVLPEQERSFYFVYGVVNPWDMQLTSSATRSYVGFGDFENYVTVDRNFPVSSFSASYDHPAVMVDSNFASDKLIEGEIKDKNGDLYRWKIDIEKKWSFNGEGWLLGKLITDIEWYPAQADATCSGEVTGPTGTVSFENAPCYQDRNWGKKFPKWWTWIVSNHFEGHPDTALAIGGGQPHIWGRSPGYSNVVVGLKHKGKEYSFRPNDFDRIKININFGTWEVTAWDRNYKLEIKAFAPKESFLDLEFMTPEGEVFHDYETLRGNVEIKIYKKQRRFGPDRWILQDTLKSNNTGIEYGSRNQYDLKSLFSNKIRLF